MFLIYGLLFCYPYHTKIKMTTSYSLKKEVVTFSTNKRYQKYAYTLIKSLQGVQFRGDILCRCVNCDMEFIDFLLSNNIKVIIDNKSLSKKKYLKNPTEIFLFEENKLNKDCICDEEITYTCHSRFYNATHAFQYDTVEKIMLVDCDFLAIKNFDHIFNIQSDIQIMDHKNCMHEDCMILSNNNRVRKFLSEVISYIEGDIRFWDRDTEALQKGFARNADLIVSELPLKYKDYSLQDDSYMWSGDGSSKYQEKFIKFIKKILLEDRNNEKYF